MPLASRWRCETVAYRGGARGREKVHGELNRRRRGHGEARPFFDPKHGPLGANFLGGTGPGPLEFLPANRYHTVSPSNRYQHLPSPLIYRPVIKFPSINVKRCNRVLVDARRSPINSANLKWKSVLRSLPSSSPRFVLRCFDTSFCARWIFVF